MCYVMNYKVNKFRWDGKRVELKFKYLWNSSSLYLRVSDSRKLLLTPLENNKRRGTSRVRHEDMWACWRYSKLREERKRHCKKESRIFTCLFHFFSIWLSTRTAAILRLLTRETRGKTQKTSVAEIGCEWWKKFFNWTWDVYTTQAKLLVHEKKNGARSSAKQRRMLGERRCVWVWMRGLNKSRV